MKRFATPVAFRQSLEQRFRSATGTGVFSRAANHSSSIRSVSSVSTASRNSGSIVLLSDIPYSSPSIGGDAFGGGAKRGGAEL